MSDDDKVEPTIFESEGSSPVSLTGDSSRAYQTIWELYKAMMAAIRGEKPNFPPSSGYAPFLKACGLPGELANAAGPMIKIHSFDMERNASRMTIAVHAFRFLSVPRQSRSHTKNQVRVLIATYEETTFLHHIFGGDVKGLAHLVQALKAYEEGDDSAYKAIFSIAASIAPKLSINPGPKPKAETIAHEILGQFVAEITQRKPRSYTWNETSRECCDPMTEATRVEFGNPDFDPRPASRRAHRARQASA